MRNGRELFCRQELLDRSWTDTLIKKLLPSGDEERPNPHYKSATPMKYYFRDRVEQEEKLCCVRAFDTTRFDARRALKESEYSRSPDKSLWYAQKKTKCRFQRGEKAISKNAEYSYKYARYVIDGRWELGEAAITKNEKYARLYAMHVIRGNWTQELAVMCPCWLYLYAKDVSKGRLPTVLHKTMLCFGIVDSSDLYVKKYFGSQKYHHSERGQK